MGNSCQIKTEHSLSTQHNSLCEGVGGWRVAAAGREWLE